MRSRMSHGRNPRVHAGTLRPSPFGDRIYHHSSLYKHWNLRRLLTEGRCLVREKGAQAVVWCECSPRSLKKDLLSVERTLTVGGLP